MKTTEDNKSAFWREAAERERQSPLYRFKLYENNSRDMHSALENVKIEKTYVGYLIWTKCDNERLKEEKAPHPLLRVKFKVPELGNLQIFVNALQEENNNFCYPLLPTASEYDPFPDKKLSNEALIKMSNLPEKKRKFRLKILKHEDMPGCRMSRHFRVSSDQVSLSNIDCK
jgi:hypothetical protein